RPGRRAHHCSHSRTRIEMVFDRKARHLAALVRFDPHDSDVRLAAGHFVEEQLRGERAWRNFCFADAHFFAGEETEIVKAANYAEVLRIAQRLFKTLSDFSLKVFRQRRSPSGS